MISSVWVNEHDHRSPQQEDWIVFLYLHCEALIDACSYICHDDMEPSWWIRFDHGEVLEFYLISSSDWEIMRLSNFLDSFEYFLSLFWCSILSEIGSIDTREDHEYPIFIIHDTILRLFAEIQYLDIYCTIRHDTVLCVESMEFVVFNELLTSEGFIELDYHILILSIYEYITIPATCYELIWGTEEICIWIVFHVHIITDSCYYIKNIISTYCFDFPSPPYMSELYYSDIIDPSDISGIERANTIIPKLSKRIG